LHARRFLERFQMSLNRKALYLSLRDRFF